MIYRTEGINIMVRIFIQMILFDVRGSVSNYPPRLELPRLTVRNVMWSLKSKQNQNNAMSQNQKGIPVT